MTTTTDSSTPLTYEKDIKPLALQLARDPKLRPKLAAIYRAFRVQIGSELREDQLAEALAWMEGVAAGGEPPTTPPDPAALTVAEWRELQELFDRRMNMGAT